MAELHEFFLGHNKEEGRGEWRREKKTREEDEFLYPWGSIPTNIPSQKLIWMASFMLPLGLDYVQWSINVILMVAEMNH